jgi:hypothetical protein
MNSFLLPGCKFLGVSASPFHGLGRKREKKKKKDPWKPVIDHHSLLTFYQQSRE